MVETAVPSDIAAMSFEDALAELELIVRRLEGGRPNSTRPSFPTSAGPSLSGIAKVSSPRPSKE